MRFYEARSDKIRFTGRAAENGDGSLSREPRRACPSPKGLRRGRIP